MRGRKFKYDPNPYDSVKIKWSRLGIELKDIKPQAFINKYGRDIPDGTNLPACSVFGCGRLLSLTEQLHGTKCIHHQQININHETLHRTNA